MFCGKSSRVCYACKVIQKVLGVAASETCETCVRGDTGDTYTFAVADGFAAFTDEVKYLGFIISRLLTLSLIPL